MLVVWRLLLVPVSVARPEVCSEAGLVACTALLTRALDKHDLGFVRTEAELDGLCGDLLRGIACVRSFVANCSSAETRASFQLTASGALRTSSQLCTPRSDLRKGGDNITLHTFPFFRHIENQPGKCLRFPEPLELLPRDRPERARVCRGLPQHHERGGGGQQQQRQQPGRAVLVSIPLFQRTVVLTVDCVSLCSAATRGSCPARCGTWRWCRCAGRAPCSSYSATSTPTSAARCWSDRAQQLLS